MLVSDATTDFFKVQYEVQLQYPMSKLMTTTTTIAHVQQVPPTSLPV